MLNFENVHVEFSHKTQRTRSQRIPGFALQICPPDGILLVLPYFILSVQYPIISKSHFSLLSHHLKRRAHVRHQRIAVSEHLVHAYVSYSISDQIQQLVPNHAEVDFHGS